MSYEYNYSQDLGVEPIIIPDRNKISSKSIDLKDEHGLCSVSRVPAYTDAEIIHSFFCRTADHNAQRYSTPTLECHRQGADGRAREPGGLPEIRQFCCLAYQGVPQIHHGPLLVQLSTREQQHTSLRHGLRTPARHRAC